MPKTRFGDVLRNARERQGFSLRQLAERVDIDYSRLAKIEHGTRPAPGLAAVRRLAEALDLDMADLVVSAGTSREVMESLLWAERLQEAAVGADVPGHLPERAALLKKNTYVADVVEREGALCTLKLGSIRLRAFSFTNAGVLTLRVPPEAVIVFRKLPEPVLGYAEGVFPMSVIKLRHLGGATNLVLAGGDIEMNALMSRGAARAAGHRVGDNVHVLLPAAAIWTSTVSEGS